MNPQGSIGTTIQESNSAGNWNIFDSVRGTSDLAYRGLLWHGAEKSESENLGGNKIFENAEREDNVEVEKKWGHKFYNLESQRFRLDSRWSESHQLKSTYSSLFDKHRINEWFSQHLCNRKNIVIAGTFGKYTLSGTRSTNIYLWEIKWPSINITWLISRKRDT